MLVVVGLGGEFRQHRYNFLASVIVENLISLLTILFIKLQLLLLLEELGQILKRCSLL